MELFTGFRLQWLFDRGILQPLCIVPAAQRDEQSGYSWCWLLLNQIPTRRINILKHKKCRKWYIFKHKKCRKWSDLANETKYNQIAFKEIVQNWLQVSLFRTLGDACRGCCVDQNSYLFGNILGSTVYQMFFTCKINVDIRLNINSRF